jgi:hypothetical protein
MSADILSADTSPSCIGFSVIFLTVSNVNTCDVRSDCVCNDGIRSDGIRNDGIFLGSSVTSCSVQIHGEQTLGFLEASGNDVSCNILPI